MSMKQPEALRLAADLNENADLDAAEGGNPQVCLLENDAAAELLRLHAENEILNAENDSLRAVCDNMRIAIDEWFSKTEWVQKSCQAHELGKHRADVLRERIERLHKIAAPFQPAAPAQATAKLPEPANTGTAPQFLILNDQTMWARGWNACLDAARAAHNG